MIFFSILRHSLLGCASQPSILELLQQFKDKALVVEKFQQNSTYFLLRKNVHSQSLLVIDRHIEMVLPKSMVGLMPKVVPSVGGDTIDRILIE